MVSLLAAEQGVRPSPRLWAEEVGSRPPSRPLEAVSTGEDGRLPELLAPG